MARPTRNADPNEILSSQRTFFVTAKTSLGRNILQSERMALLFIDVLREYMKAKKFVVDDFVVMPDHVHVLFTLDSTMSVERATGLIKGRFSFRAKRELGYSWEIWQPGFSDVGIKDRASFLAHREYIYNNPVKRGLVDSPEKYPYCSLYLKRKKKRRG
jgi:putative transposase